MLTPREKKELKINHRRILINSIEIGITPPEQVFILGHRRIFNGKVVGKVTNSKTLNYKSFIPHRDGLFCERIFGPVHSYICACDTEGPLRTNKYKRSHRFCPTCEVEYTDQRVRRYRVGYIGLVSPVTHIWHLKGRPSYISLFLGKRKKTLARLTYCNDYLVEQSFSKVIKGLTVSRDQKQKKYKKGPPETSYTHGLLSDGVQPLQSGPRHAIPASNSATQTRAELELGRLEGMSDVQKSSIQDQEMRSKDALKKADDLLKLKWSSKKEKDSYTRSQTLPFLPSFTCDFALRDWLLSFFDTCPPVEDIPIPVYCKVPRRYPLRDVHKFMADQAFSKVQEISSLKSTVPFQPKVYLKGKQGPSTSSLYAQPERTVNQSQGQGMAIQNRTKAAPEPRTKDLSVVRAGFTYRLGERLSIIFNKADLKSSSSLTRGTRNSTANQSEALVVAIQNLRFCKGFARVAPLPLLTTPLELELGRLCLPKKGVSLINIHDLWHASVGTVNEKRLSLRGVLLNIILDRIVTTLIGLTPILGTSSNEPEPTMTKKDYKTSGFVSRLYKTVGKGSVGLADRAIAPTLVMARRVGSRVSNMPLPKAGTEQQLKRTGPTIQNRLSDQRSLTELRSVNRAATKPGVTKAALSFASQNQVSPLAKPEGAELRPTVLFRAAGVIAGGDNLPLWFCECAKLCEPKQSFGYRGGSFCKGFSSGSPLTLQSLAQGQTKNSHFSKYPLSKGQGKGATRAKPLQNRRFCIATTKAKLWLAVELRVPRGPGPGPFRVLSRSLQDLAEPKRTAKSSALVRAIQNRRKGSDSAKSSGFVRAQSLYGAFVEPRTLQDLPVVMARSSKAGFVQGNLVWTKDIFNLGSPFPLSLIAGSVLEGDRNKSFYSKRKRKIVSGDLCFQSWRGSWLPVIGEPPTRLAIRLSFSDGQSESCLASLNKGWPEVKRTPNQTANQSLYKSGAFVEPRTKSENLPVVMARFALLMAIQNQNVRFCKGDNQTLTLASPLKSLRRLDKTGGTVPTVGRALGLGMPLLQVQENRRKAFKNSLSSSRFTTKNKNKIDTVLFGESVEDWLEYWFDKWLQTSSKIKFKSQPLLRWLYKNRSLKSPPSVYEGVAITDLRSVQALKKVATYQNRVLHLFSGAAVALDSKSPLKKEKETTSLPMRSVGPKHNIASYLSRHEQRVKWVKREVLSSFSFSKSGREENRSLGLGDRIGESRTGGKGGSIERVPNLESQVWFPKVVTIFQVSEKVDFGQKIAVWDTPARTTKSSRLSGGSGFTKPKLDSLTLPLTPLTPLTLPLTPLTPLSKSGRVSYKLGEGKSGRVSYTSTLIKVIKVIKVTASKSGRVLYKLGEGKCKSGRVFYRSRVAQQLKREPDSYFSVALKEFAPDYSKGVPPLGVPQLVKSLALPSKSWSKTGFVRAQSLYKTVSRTKSEDLAQQPKLKTSAKSSDFVRARTANQTGRNKSCPKFCFAKPSFAFSETRGGRASPSGFVEGCSALVRRASPSGFVEGCFALVMAIQKLPPRGQSFAHEQNLRFCQQNQSQALVVARLTERSSVSDQRSLRRFCKGSALSFAQQNQVIALGQLPSGFAKSETWFCKAKLRAAFVEPRTKDLPVVIARSSEAGIDPSMQAQLDLQAIREILSYTSGGALRELLRCFDTQAFSAILLNQIKILLDHHRGCIKHESDRPLEPVTEANFPLSLLELPWMYNPADDRYEDLPPQINRFSRSIHRTARRLKIVQLLMRNNRRPEWMLISGLPVLPPDLRPILQMSEDLIVASDLNTLYQRVIYRNNRQHKLRIVEWSYATSFQRLVQDAVDRLIENGKGGSKPFVTPGGRPLKSLSDTLKGKKGRFRLNLLGKRVDFSGRSVIVVSPHLKIHECGLPREMALELYHYLLIRELVLKKKVSSVILAKEVLRQRQPKAFVWDILRELIYHHPLLLNRAPTLHRLGIQAFQPKLVLGSTILLHPLVCAGFNADFDGDQMGVHLPLCDEARAEAWDLLWSRNNLLSPATGEPILLPSQDMVLGFYHMTALLPFQVTTLSRTKLLSYRTRTELLQLELRSSWSSSVQLRIRIRSRAGRSTVRMKANPFLRFFCRAIPIPKAEDLAVVMARFTSEEKCSGKSRTLTTFGAEAKPYTGFPSQAGVRRTWVRPPSRHHLELEKGLRKPHFFSPLDVVRAYQNGNLDIHTPIWVQWNGKIENDDSNQIPLELRINSFGVSTQLYPSYKSRKEKEKEKEASSQSKSALAATFNLFIRTTAGRVIVNNILPLL